MLPTYGGDAITPNIERLARRSVVFDQHWCGSVPCMPARRDIMTGRLNFLEKPWGAMEPFDQSLQDILSGERNIHTRMFSDHAHYLIPGGENYTKGFTAWEVNRGQEGDPVWTRPCKDGNRPDVPPVGFKGTWSEAERENRSHFKTEYDYPSVKTLWHAAEWLEENHEADNFFLWVEAFDPHEPYDCPKYYLDLYEKEGDYDGYDFTHPSYQPNEFTPEETAHLNRRCKAVTTMTDRHLGEIFDVMDRYGMWEDTMVVLTTDHGYHLGEHGYMAKNYMMPYNEVFHIPLLVAAPGVAPGRCSAVTQNIDVLPTMLEYFHISQDVLQYPIHGRSLMPALRRESDTVHESVIYGYFGKQIGWTDGKYTYVRAARNADNQPLYFYTAMPTTLRQVLGANDSVRTEDYKRIEMGRFLSWTDYPVYRFPADIVHWGNASQAFEVRTPFNEETVLFDLEADYAQEHPVLNDALEAECAAKMKRCMADMDAPTEQFVRLGL